MDQVVIRETLSITQQNVTDEDKAIGSEVNRLTWKALAIADEMLDFGSDRDRAMVVRLLLNSAAKLSSLDSKTQIDESRMALFNTVDKLAQVNEVRPIVTASEILDAVTTESPDA